MSIKEQLKAKLSRLLPQRDERYAGQLEAIVDGGTRGDPRKPLRWMCKSMRAIARARSARGIEVSDRTVARSLREQGFSLQGVRNTVFVSVGTNHDAKNIWEEIPTSGDCRDRSTVSNRPEE